MQDRGTRGGPRPVGLVGRRDEQEALDRLLDGARSGRSGVLVVRGEAGVGKTALLEYLAERASGCEVARATGVQADTELAFAGLQQMFAPLLGPLESLPDPQREALAVAFGLRRGPAPDRFLVGLAVLGLLAELAEARPLVCVVDDAQWLDRASAQTLAFVARRLLGESVALVFAMREPTQDQTFAGLSELVVRGLSDADARRLLGSVIRGRLDDRVIDRIVAETRGNPLALLELPHGLPAGEPAGGFGVSPSVPVLARLEGSFLQRLRDLPAATQRMVLLAAAEPVGDPVLLLLAGERLGLGVDAVAPAEVAGLLEVGTRVRFRHPLVRSAVYTAVDRFEALARAAQERIVRQGVEADNVSHTYVAEMRYVKQVFEVGVTLDLDELRAGGSDALGAAFESAYESLYGKGSGFREAGIELVTLRVTAVGRSHIRPQLPTRPIGKSDASSARRGLGKGTARSWVAEHWDFLTDGWAASQPGGAEAVADIVRKDLDGATKAAAEARVDAPFAELAARLMPPALAKQLRHEEGRQ